MITFHIALAVTLTIDVKKGEEAILIWTIPTNLLTAPRYEILLGLSTYVINKLGGFWNGEKKRFGDRFSATKENNLIKVQIKSVLFSDEATFLAIAKFSPTDLKIMGETRMEVTGMCQLYYDCKSRYECL